MFCDASNDAYSVLACLKRWNETQMLCSKTSIAPDPKRSVSIPRLELLNELLAARLSQQVEEAVDKEKTKKKLLWMDSAIAFWSNKKRCWPMETVRPQQTGRK